MFFVYIISWNFHNIFIEFHISDCVATNGESGESEKRLVLVENGCVRELGNELHPRINPIIADDGKTFMFDQFAFANGGFFFV